MHKQTTVNKIYDPACGSGSLLLQAKKHFDNHIIEDGFFGQEINHTTYNLARMNMFLHNVNYDTFNIALGDTVRDPHYKDEKPFDAIFSNPPNSVNWIGSDDPTLINDDRFAPAGVLAPKSKAEALGKNGGEAMSRVKFMERLLEGWFPERENLNPFF